VGVGVSRPTVQRALQRQGVYADGGECDPFLADAVPLLCDVMVNHRHPGRPRACPPEIAAEVLRLSRLGHGTRCISLPSCDAGARTCPDEVFSGSLKARAYTRSRRNS